MQQTYRLPPWSPIVQQTYRLLPWSPIVQQTYRLLPDLLSCSKPTVFPLVSCRAVNLPPSPLVSCRAVNLPPSPLVSYRAANLPPSPPGLLSCSKPTVSILWGEPPRLNLGKKNRPKRRFKCLRRLLLLSYFSLSWCLDSLLCIELLIQVVLVEDRASNFVQPCFHYIVIPMSLSVRHSCDQAARCKR